MNRLVSVSISLLVTLMASCSATASADACAPLSADNVDRCLHINQLQFLGTHNSYHIEPSPRRYAAMDSIQPGWGEHIAYTHRPLATQLGELNIRQLELDVFADPEGGHYARPVGQRLAGEPELLEGERMSQPGFKVLHVQDLDYRSVCPTLVACLEEVKAWSVSSPDHLPVLILIEAKDSRARDTLQLGFVEPLPIRAAELDALDAEILSVLGRDRIITPDDVRRRHPSLDQAVRRDGWPTIAEARGKFLFALDNTGIHRDEYMREHPELEGRVMFVSSPPGESTSGFVKMNEVLADAALIRSYVERGNLVRTRADIPVREGKTGNTARRDAALESGAQYVSTDYPEPSPLEPAYRVWLPGADGRPARCNPVSAPAGCRNDWIVE